MPLVHAQFTPRERASVSLRYALTRAQTIPGTCCFYLGGGAADLSLPLLPHVSAVVDVAGGTTERVAGTSRGLSTITLLAGPRLTQPLGRVAVAGQALFGAARGFDADFTGVRGGDTATSFAFAIGGFAELPLFRAIRLRPVQVDYLQTNLPNGADNSQRNLRLSAGVTFVIPIQESRR